MGQGSLPQQNRDGADLVLNVGVDPLQHPLAGVLVRQVGLHLCRGRAERCSRRERLAHPSQHRAGEHRNSGEIQNKYSCPSIYCQSRRTWTKTIQFLN